MLTQQQEQEYQQFMSDYLQKDLSYLIEQRQEIDSKMNDYTELLLYVEQKKQFSNQKQKVKVDIGSGWLMNANIQNDEPFYMDMGLGLYLQLNDHEIQPIIIKRQSIFENKKSRIDHQILKLQEQIISFQKALQEIKNLV